MSTDRLAGTRKHKRAFLTCLQARVVARAGISTGGPAPAVARASFPFPLQRLAVDLALPDEPEGGRGGAEADDWDQGSTTRSPIHVASFEC
jgi:hypothetical protein